MAEYLIKTELKAKICTKCLICENTIPVYEHTYVPKVCNECKSAVSETKRFLKQIKEYNPWIAERLEKQGD